jgi:excisionase family DNA binding protein
MVIAEDQAGWRIPGIEQGYDMREETFPDPEPTDTHSIARTEHGNDGDRWLTLDEVAEMLNVHPDTIRRWHKLGVIKSHRTGRRGKQRFSRDEIATFLP